MHDIGVINLFDERTSGRSFADPFKLQFPQGKTVTL